MKKSQRNGVLTYVYEKYGVTPDYPWLSSPSNAVLRNGDSGKWFAIIMEVDGEKLGLNKKDTVDVINIKCTPDTIATLLGEDGFLPAYHMNKEHWMTLLLDWTVKCEMIHLLIDKSYNIIAEKNKRKPIK